MCGHSTPGPQPIDFSWLHYPGYTVHASVLGTAALLILLLGAFSWLRKAAKGPKR